jgi:hypothetical protein
MFVVTVEGEIVGGAPLTDVSVIVTDSVPLEMKFGLRFFDVEFAAGAGITSVNVGATSPLCGVVDVPPDVPGVTGAVVTAPPPPPVHAASAPYRLNPIVIDIEPQRVRCFALPVIDDVVYVTTNVGSVFV